MSAPDEPEEGEAPPPEEQPPEEQPAEQPPEEQPPEQPAEEQPAEQPAEEQPAEQPAEEQPPEQPPEEQPAEEQPAAEASGEDEGEDEDDCACFTDLDEEVGEGEAEGEVDGEVIGSPDEGAGAGGWAAQTFSCPVDSTYITSDIGYRVLQDKKTGAKKPQCHKALDIGARKGTAVRAIFDGVVRDVWTSFGGYGLAIYVDHGVRDGMGLRSFYAHLGRIDVKKGDRVARGAVIGLSGDSGVAKGKPHLHFAVHRYQPGTNPEWRSRDAVSIDPRPYLCDPLRERLDARRARRPVRFTKSCKMG